MRCSPPSAAPHCDCVVIDVVGILLLLLLLLLSRCVLPVARAAVTVHQQSGERAGEARRGCGPLLPLRRAAFSPHTHTCRSEGPTHGNRHERTAETKRTATTATGRGESSTGAAETLRDCELLLLSPARAQPAAREEPRLVHTTHRQPLHRTAHTSRPRRGSGKVRQKGNKKAPAIL